jgi:putative tryptophan/tyrosine transport system substrate-binding protein
MRRRQFILGGAAALAPLAARAQQTDRIKLLATLLGTAETNPESQRRIAAFRDGLKAFGWIEGKTVRIESRWGSGSPERIRQFARELVDLKPDVILTNGTPSAAAIKAATSTIPVVFAVITDPIGDGFVASLARPGSNMTGFTAFESEIGGKWVDVLRDVSPKLTRIGLLFNPRTVPGGGTSLMRPFFDAAARSMGADPVPLPVGSAADIERSLIDFARPGAGLVAMPDGFLFFHGALIVKLSNELQLPAVYPFRHFAELGGLISYGVDSADLNRRAAAYVDRILNGNAPADLPVQTPTKVELVLNLKTAKAMSIDIPLSLQSRADEVIE